MHGAVVRFAVNGINPSTAFVIIEAGLSGRKILNLSLVKNFDQQSGLSHYQLLNSIQFVVTPRPQLFHERCNLYVIITRNCKSIC